MSHRLIFGAGAQTVRTVPLRDGRGVPVGSATYAVLDLRYSAGSDQHVLAEGAAALDPVSTTLAAPTGRGTPDPRSMVVASAVGIVSGRRYLLRSGGHVEVVKVEALDGATLRLTAALPHYFPTGAVLVGIELAASISAEIAASDAYLAQSNLVIRWTPADLPAYQEQIFLERVAPAPIVGPDDVLSMDSTLHAYLGEGVSIAGAVAMALEDFRVDMLAAGVEDTQILAGPIGQSAVKYRAAYHVLKHSADVSAVSRAEKYDQRYQELRTSLLVGDEKAKVAHVNADNAKQPPSIRSLFLPSW
ncbi:hypothetical protein OV203_02460 [Nannocystis sp. ILAH1]|uniref:hypothetical protein n=1 Tax=Nannocystis sp. ILAH1 TaxID=2996789 RepID=UPI00226F4A1A|nr:hypothetical protein [Nannocystis sp. ILAH1]MCY0985974.1 hypothetical protein [Nannocystis sp. ILAH1]